MCGDPLNYHILGQTFVKASAMKYLIILTAVALATADRLENVYLPPNSARSAGGAGVGLQAPLEQSQKLESLSGSSSASASASGSATAEILKYDSEANEQGYRYAYETSDGTKAEQEGRIIPGAKPEEGSLQVSGSYSYIGDDGQTYTVTYTADENGYRAEGAHLPTPPPIPAEILKSLHLTDTSRGQYDSQKSSYDADAGY